MPSWDRARKRWRAKVILNKQCVRSDFKTKREALDWEAETRDGLQKAMTTAPTPVATDFRTCFNKYLDEVKLLYDAKTYDNKNRVLKRLSNFLKRELELEVIPLSEVTTDLVKDYLVSQLKGIPKESEKPRTPAGYNEDLKHLKAAWAWGVEKGEILQNPVQNVKKLPHKSPEGYTPPTEDMDKVLAMTNLTERVFLGCYLDTGARRSEVFKWKWDEDIDFKNKRVRLTTRKTKDGSYEHVWIPMNEDLHKKLTWWRDNRPIKDTPYVFVSTSNRHHGKPFTTRRRFIKGLCERAGVKAFQFHALRRYVASVLAQNHNVSILTIQRILRHKKLATTELYVKDINRDMKNVLELLGTESAEEPRSHEDSLT